MKFDPTVLFYLKNQLLIDEWHELRKRVPELANQFFLSLDESLQEALDDLPGGPQLHRIPEGGHPKLLLVKSAWKTPKGLPRVAIGIEWRAADVDFRSSYTGLWTDRESKESRGISNAFRKALKDFAPKHGYTQYHWWPLLRDEEPPDGYWEDLDGFREALVASLSSQWRLLHSRVDQLLAETAPKKK